MNHALYLSLLSEIEDDCRVMVGWACKKGLPFPSYEDREDRIQDLLGLLLCLSGHADFTARNWRRKVCKMRLLKMSKWRTRYDADAYNLVDWEATNDQTAEIQN